MRKHPKILTEAGVSKYRLKELQAICAQFKAYKRGYLGEIGKQRMKKIKAAAQAVAPDAWQDLIVNVTDETAPAPEEGRSDFYRQRLAFWIVLHDSLRETPIPAEDHADACASCLQAPQKGVNRRRSGGKPSQIGG